MAGLETWGWLPIYIYCMIVHRRVRSGSQIKENDFVDQRGVWQENDNEWSPVNYILHDVFVQRLK
jgi:hypothetical protein